ncbi:MAG TPA: hypothetical protein PK360_11110, partial [bacterium]|nr:hypothetical protein [bacterium]
MKKRRPPHPFTPDSEAIHPPEWEELLKDVTIERDYHEIPYDPACLAALEPVDSPYLETDDSG